MSTEPTMKPYVIGLDLGGTNSVFGIVDSRGDIKVTTAIKTQGYKNVEDYVKASVEALQIIIDQVGGIDNIKAMGIGAPNGNYLVQVHYFGSESGAITNYRVTINIGNQTFGPYTGSIAYHQLITIGTIIMPDGTVSRSSTKPIFIENTKKEEIYKEFPKK